GSACPFLRKNATKTALVVLFFCKTGKTDITRSLYLLGVADFGAVAVIAVVESLRATFLRVLK
ncbi:MAG: hypothetical protein PUB29_11175, partial [Bacteroidales bacterium]|nr:hypothetical protein [Bacteroidales bacterium]